MNIYVKVSKFYDYIDTSQGDADRQMADGSWRKRVIVNTPSETTVILPQWQIDDIAKHQNKTEEEAVAWLLEEKIMPGQAPRDAWGNIEVHDNKPMAKYLNNLFGKEKQNVN